VQLSVQKPGHFRVVKSRKKKPEKKRKPKRSCMLRLAVANREREEKIGAASQDLLVLDLGGNVAT